MTDQILLSLRGLQYAQNEEEEIEVITPGAYYKRGGKHYVVYEEVDEGYHETGKNMIKISDKVLEINKGGSIRTHMIFEKNKKHMTFYNTPYGGMGIGITATNLEVKETAENIDILVEYALEINDEFLSDCMVNINIKSKEAKDFSL